MGAHLGTLLCILRGMLDYKSKQSCQVVAVCLAARRYHRNYVTEEEMVSVMGI